MGWVQALQGVSWTFAGLASFLVLARTYSRLAIQKKFGYDDILMILALMAALICTSMIQAAVHYGLGLHYKDIQDPRDQMNAYKWTYVAPCLCLASNTLGKISIAIFLFRIMGPLGNLKKRITLWIIICVAVALNIMAIGILAGACIPTAKMWDPTHSGRCVDNVAGVTFIIGMLQASFSAATDYALAIFPSFILWNLNMPWKLKAGLCAVMAAGVLAGVATTAKVVMFKSLLRLEVTDITYAWAPITIAYTLEMYLIVICGTVPILRPLYLLCLGRLLSTMSKSMTKTTLEAGDSEEGRGGQENIPLEDRTPDRSAKSRFPRRESSRYDEFLAWTRIEDEEATISPKTDTEIHYVK